MVYIEMQEDLRNNNFSPRFSVVGDLSDLVVATSAPSKKSHLGLFWMNEIQPQDLVPWGKILFFFPSRPTPTVSPNPLPSYPPPPSYLANPFTLTYPYFLPLQLLFIFQVLHFFSS